MSEYTIYDRIRVNTDNVNPTIGELVSEIKDPILGIYANKFDAIKKENPLPNNKTINDLGIKYGDHLNKLWYGIDKSKNLTKSKKRLLTSKLPIADDLNEMISKYHSKIKDTSKGDKHSSKRSSKKCNIKKQSKKKRISKKGGKSSSKYNKKHNKTKKCKNKQKGGLFVKIDENHLLNWETPHSLDYDCTPCALNFIGYDREYCDVMCGLYGTTGTRVKDVLDILKHKYPNFNFNLKKLKSMKSIVDKFDDDTITDTDLEEYKNILLELFNDIPNNYSMMGQIKFKDAKFGHSVVFGKLNDKPLFYDTQNDVFINDLDDIILHLITHRVISVGVYYGRSKTTTHMLVDDYSLGL
jgi:hypothetical protein